MDRLKAIDLCSFGMLEANTNVVHFEELINEWGDPNDIAVRAAEMLKKCHQNYGVLLFKIHKVIKTNCKHPKKMQDVCNGVRYCMNCNSDLKKI